MKDYFDGFGIPLEKLLNGTYKNSSLFRADAINIGRKSYEYFTKQNLGDCPRFELHSSILV